MFKQAVKAKVEEETLAVKTERERLERIERAKNRHLSQTARWKRRTASLEAALGKEDPKSKLPQLYTKKVKCSKRTLFDLQEKFKARHSPKKLTVQDMEETF